MSFPDLGLVAQPALDVSAAEPGSVPSHPFGAVHVAESGRLRPSAAACAKRGCVGQMQTPAELVPIPETSGCVPDASLMRPDTSGCVPDASGFWISAHFGEFW